MQLTIVLSFSTCARLSLIMTVVMVGAFKFCFMRKHRAHTSAPFTASTHYKCNISGVALVEGTFLPNSPLTALVLIKILDNFATKSLALLALRKFH
jgi:hypothetical protein